MVVYICPKQLYTVLQYYYRRFQVKTRSIYFTNTIDVSKNIKGVKKMETVFYK